MNENKLLQQLATKAADGNIRSDDDLSYLRDQHISNNLKRLSALKSAFNSTNKIEKDDIDSQIPENWGHLKIMEMIGQGAFGTVYRAFDSVLHRDVALKLSRVKQQQETSNSYILEARRLARVNHPNVLAVHGADIHQNRIGIWSDLIEGETLLAKINQTKKLTNEEIIDIAEQLVYALDAIHQHDLIHGDIKAENVMLVQSRVILMDFGASQRMGKMSSFSTPETMAPEQLKGQAVSAATDIYSLGALLYQLCVNQSVQLIENKNGQLESSINKTLLKKKRGKTLANMIALMLSLDSKSRPNTQNIIETLNKLKSWPVRRFKWAAIAIIFVSLLSALLLSLFATYQAEENYKSSEMLNNLVINSMNELNPKNNVGPDNALKMYQTMVEKARSELVEYPQVQANILVTVGKNMFALGEQNNGIALVKEGLNLILENSSNSNQKLQQAYSILSILHRGRAEYKEASIALNQSLFHHQLIDYKDDDEAQKETIKLLTTKANLTGQLGDWHGRLELNKKIFLQREALVGKDASWLAIDYYHIGQDYYLLNNYSEALMSYQHAVTLLEKEGDRQSIRFLYVQTEIMATQIKLGNFKEGRRLLKYLRQQYPLLVAKNHSIYATLDTSETSIIAMEGDMHTAIIKLKQLLQNKSLEPKQIYRIKLSLIKYSLSLNLWQQARVYLDQISKHLTNFYTPTYPYLEGASEYVNYRLGIKTSPPIKELDNAISTMQLQQYDVLAEYAELVAWREIVLNSLAIEN